MDVTEFVTALVVAAGIPSALTGLLFWQLKRIIEKKEKKREESDKVRQQNELMIIKGIGAAIALSEATASAVQRIPDAHCNGDMHAALEYARKVKHKHKDFLYETAVDSIMES